MTLFQTGSLGISSTVTGIPLSQSFSDFVNKFMVGIESVGLVYVPSTGSIPSGSVGSLTPPITNTWPYFVIYRLNDELHMSQSNELYIKIWIGTESNSSISLKPQIGFYHDGNGSIGLVTETTSVNLTINMNNHYVSGTFSPLKMCSISGSNFVMSYADNVTTMMSFCVERTRDEFGNATNYGAYIYGLSALNSVQRAEFLPSGSGRSHLGQYVFKYPMGPGTMQSYPGRLPFFTFVPVYDGYFPPSVLVGVVSSAHFTTDTTHQFQLYGTSSVFFVCSSNLIYDLLAEANNDTTPRYMIRFE